jgi:hypothetical protein
MNKKLVVRIQDSLEMVGFIKSNGTQCRFVSMICETPVKKIKVGNPFPGVMKVAKKFGMVNVNYVDSVRRKVANTLNVDMSDVEYVAGETWYKHLTTEDGKNLPIVVNKTKDDGKYYLQYFPTKSESVYQMPDGSIVPDEKIKPYLYAESKRPSFKPCVISVDVANIKQLNASGVIMKAEDLEEAVKALEAIDSDVTVDIGTNIATPSLVPA